jgi:hypothetical protein
MYKYKKVCIYFVVGVNAAAATIIAVDAAH